MNRGVSFKFLTVCALFSVSIGVNSSDVPAAVDPEAAQILKRMSDYLDSVKRFSFKVKATVDEITQSGQQLQAHADIDISIQRPNRIRMNRNADIVDQELYFDGKTLTLYSKDENYYGNLKLSKSVDINTGLDLARDEIGVYLPAADLVYQNAYQALMEDVESGMLVGTSTVGGKEVHHLAFRGDEVDWQIWIENGDRPLPRKYLITSKWIAGAPQFTTVLSDWDPSANLEDKLFQFAPPPEAEEIEFIPLRGGFESR